jgi:hypothetical protein
MAEDDLEPIDLEPVDLQPADAASPFERARRRRPAWVWIAVVTAGLGAWAAIALTTQGSSGHVPLPPVPPTTANTLDRERVDRTHAVSQALLAGMKTLGVRHFAAVIDDRLYVFDGQKPSVNLVPLPEGHVAVTAQSGPSLLASTFQQTLVSTNLIATATLSPRDTALPATTPDHWWLLHNDGTIRRADQSVGEQVPNGLRVVAAVTDGFVALDSNSGTVVWSRSTITPIAPVGQFLAAGPRTLVFMNHCGYSGCRVEIYDTILGTVIRMDLPRVPNFAAFSPNGKRLAIGSTLGDVFIIDPVTGSDFARTDSVALASPSLPFTWTPDGRALLVVQNDRIEVRRASDGIATGEIRETAGVEQLIALP